MDWPGRVECNGVGMFFRRDNHEVLRRALDFEVVVKRGRGQPNMTWKRQVGEHIDKIGLKKEDTSN